MSLAAILIPIVQAQQALTPPSNPDPKGLPSCTSIFASGMGDYPGQGFYCIASYLGMLTYMLMGFGAALALIFLIVNGIRYMVGPAFPGGSSDAAKKGITTALTGVAVAMLVYLIVDTLVSAVTQ